MMITKENSTFAIILFIYFIRFFFSGKNHCACRECCDFFLPIPIMYAVVFRPNIGFGKGPTQIERKLIAKDNNNEY